ncbi:hypothetical protein QS306_14415 [Paraburkholderia bonniea]|nr:hypothetical protein [Paraburkholderia bonniea]WJF91965.1 hypothetical protein QS306_14415 [Paraburkholderia bonniea]WJF95284.1 hypothetical protein QS308_14420 [Paraburkholderia bonniea]
MQTLLAKFLAHGPAAKAKKYARRIKNPAPDGAEAGLKRAFFV